MSVTAFDSWQSVLDHARAGRALLYRAPLDSAPVRFTPQGASRSERTYLARARTLRMFPPGSTGRGRARVADPFTADAGHLDRFTYVDGPEEWFRPVREALRAIGWPDAALTIENTGGNCMCLFLALDEEWHALIGDPWNCDGWGGMIESGVNGDVRADLPSFPESDPAGFARAVTDAVAAFGYKPGARP